MSPDIQRITLQPSQTINQAAVVFPNTGGAVQIAIARDNRRYLRIENTGLSSMWIGASSNVSVGATGLNIGTITTGSVTTLEGFGGPLWGIFTGLSHATAHVVRVFEY